MGILGRASMDYSILDRVGGAVALAHRGGCGIRRIAVRIAIRVGTLAACGTDAGVGLGRRGAVDSGH